VALAAIAVLLPGLDGAPASAARGVPASIIAMVSASEKEMVALPGLDKSILTWPLLPDNNSEHWEPCRWIGDVAAEIASQCSGGGTTYGKKEQPVLHVHSI